MFCPAWANPKNRLNVIASTFARLGINPKSSAAKLEFRIEDSKEIGALTLKSEFELRDSKFRSDAPKTEPLSSGAHVI